MALKDYYQILNVKPDAPAPAIKQSYRKLALKYHPDRNPKDVLSAMVFSEIAEAYAVLSNPSARKIYNNQRYTTAANEYIKPAETIESLTTKASNLKTQITNADPFRFNRDALLYSIKQLLPDEILALPETNESAQKALLQIIMQCSIMLYSVQIKNLIEIMQPLFKQHYWLQQQLYTALKQQTKKERWEKYKILFAILIALMLCIVIFIVTKHYN